MTRRADRKQESQVCLGQPPCRPFRPFDQPQEAWSVVVRQPQVLEFLGIQQPIQIEMDRGDAGNS